VEDAQKSSKNKTQWNNINTAQTTLVEEQPKIKVWIGSSRDQHISGMAGR
jgi:hypothetical protein